MGVIVTDGGARRLWRRRLRIVASSKSIANPITPPYNQVPQWLDTDRDPLATSGAVAPVALLDWLELLEMDGLAVWLGVP